jgi:hypothetical protein
LDQSDGGIAAPPSPARESADTALASELIGDAGLKQNGGRSDAFPMEQEHFRARMVGAQEARLMPQLCARPSAGQS